MAKILPQRDGLRRGKFKKILVTAEELSQEAAPLAEKLAVLREHLETGRVSPALYGALWIITYLRVRHPHGWWGAHRRDAVAAHTLNHRWEELPFFDWKAEERDLLARYPTLGELFNHRAFRATPEAVHRAILEWELGHYPLVLMDRIPSVEEVLAQQVQGKRCVSLFHQPHMLGKLILGERDPLSFGFHDLIHADHFFHQNSLRTGQIGFYRQIAQLYQSGLLAPWLAIEDYPHRLEYLMADMNSHPLHLWKCFKAICHMILPVETVTLFHQQLPSYFDLPAPLTQTLQLMNGQEFEVREHGVLLTEWCEHWGRESNSLK